MERGIWSEVSPKAQELQIDELKLPELQNQAIEWVGEILGKK